MKITLLEAPICKGSPTDGAQFAFRHLIENGILHCFEENAEKLPMNLLKGDFGNEPEISSMKYAREVMAVSRKLFKNVRNELESGRFPIIVGGDHSCAMGSIAGASSSAGAENLAVVYIDGHTDINTENTTLTGFIHGMPLAAAIGLCSDTLTVGKKVNILGKNIYIIGARSIDEGEYSIVRENGVHLYTSDDVRKAGIERVMSEVKKGIEGKTVHVSFDVDFLDETVFPSTGYRMPGGFDIETLYSILVSVFETGKVNSMDIVEYNPCLDTDGQDMKKLFCIYKYISELISKYCR